MDYKIIFNKKSDVTKNILNNIKLIEITENDNSIIIENKTCNNYLKLKEFLKNKNISISIKSAYKKLDETTLYLEEYLGTVLHIESNNRNYEEYLKDFGFIKLESNVIRYVGKSTANIIYSNNLTLEEYHKKYNKTGILVVNKERGCTSHDVVESVGKIFDTKKVGHTGTLDPLASGVLILTLGKATKISNLIMSEEKTYIAKVRVGVFTDTLDITGKVLKKSNDKTPDNIEDVLKTFEKTYMQEVPIYSAVKVNGKKLYEYARQGISVELPKKEVTIKKIDLQELGENTFKFICTVSSGTYIRSLIRDIGEVLDIPLTMEELVRTKEYKYTLDDAYKIEDIRKGNYQIIGIDEALDYKVVNVDEELYKKIKNGNMVDNIYDIEDRVIFKYNDKIIAIYEKTSENYLKSFKNFT